MKYSGIDLHSNNNVIVVSDEADHILCKRRVPNELKTVLALLEPHRAELAGVVVEATYNWYWLVDGLQAAGYRVYLANTSAIKQYEGLEAAAGAEVAGDTSWPAADPADLGFASRA
jgi:transposase